MASESELNVIKPGAHRSLSGNTVFKEEGRSQTPPDYYQNVYFFYEPLTPFFAADIKFMKYEQDASPPVGELPCTFRFVILRIFADFCNCNLCVNTMTATV